MVAPIVSAGYACCVMVAVATVAPLVAKGVSFEIPIHMDEFHVTCGAFEMRMGRLPVFGARSVRLGRRLQSAGAHVA